MNKNTRQRIIDAKTRWTRIHHPSLLEPSWAHPNGMTMYYTKNDTTANGLTACIKDFLTYEGHQCERINTQGQARVRHIVDGITGSHLGSRTNGVVFTPTTGTRGSADLSSTIAVLINGTPIGLSVKWEVKMKDKQSKEQKQYEESIHRAGGHYYIVHSMDEFFHYYDKLIQPITL